MEHLKTTKQMQETYFASHKKLQEKCTGLQAELDGLLAQNEGKKGPRTGSQVNAEA